MPVIISATVVGVRKYIFSVKKTLNLTVPIYTEEMASAKKFHTRNEALDFISKISPMRNVKLLPEDILSRPIIKDRIC